MQIDINFEGRHVVVFGGTTGINFGIAQAFGRCGAHLIVASRKEGNVQAAIQARIVCPLYVPKLPAFSRFRMSATSL